MTTIDPNKKIQKLRTEEEMRKALLQLLERKHMLSVPPQVEDADMVLSDVIEELLEARKKLAILEPLRDAWFSEHAWEEALRDPGGPGKVLEPIIRPLAPVEAPLHAMLTREAAEKVVRASLARYEKQGDRFMYTGNPFTDNPSTAMQDSESSKEDALYSIDCGDCHGAESLEVLQEATQSPTLVKHFPQIPPIYWKEGEQEG